MKSCVLVLSILGQVMFAVFLPTYAVSQNTDSGRIYPAMEEQGNSLRTAAPLDQEDYFRESSSSALKQTTPAIPLKIVSTYYVTMNSDTGLGSLRAAIDSANLSAGLDEIDFNISGGDLTISLRSPLPQINYPVIIDGTTQTGFTGTPIVEIDGSLAGTGVNGLRLVGGNSVVRGLVINRFKRLPAGGNGYAITLDVKGANVIEGNYIGLDVSGTDSLPNGSGIGIFGASGGNRIGGTAPGSGNVVSGNYSTGIAIASGSIGGNTVVGNYVGTTADGMWALGNGGNGIFINAANDTIGGLQTGARNIVTASAFPGIFIGAAAPRTLVQGNYVGTDVTGEGDLGTGSNGINIRSSDNIVGDILQAGRNIFAGGGSAGMYIFSQSATRNTVINNYIGTDLTGTVAFGNSFGIVLDDAPGNVIGGVTSPNGNLIAGNSLTGVNILNATATGNKIMWNTIGGNADLGNYGDGVTINSSHDTISFNTIAFNNATGIYVAAGTQNLFERNSIYSNGSMGIDIAPTGITPNDPLDFDLGPNNLQNFPILDSSRVQSGQLIIHGRINSNPNTQLQIDFYTDDDYDPSHFGEGQKWSTLVFVTTDAQGNAPIYATLPIVSGTPPFITATATDPQGNTSEFSQALGTLDTDGDGILDAWETRDWGIDVNSDGKIDLDLWAKGARPDHKDIFVEVDAMSGMEPETETLQRVVHAFETGPGSLVTNPDGAPGIHLWCLPIDETTITPVAWPYNYWDFFHAVKQQHFGTLADRTDPDSTYILEARKLVYRYCLFAFEHDSVYYSGVAEKWSPASNDFMITLGTFTPSGGTEDQKAAVFMHELGHTLGLRHGGGDDIQYKPNYVSIMNYTWQFKYKWSPAFWALNYSTVALPTLSENSLVEQDGLMPDNSAPGMRIIGIPYSDPDRNLLYATLAPNTIVDWNGDHTVDTDPVQVDLNSFNLNLDPSPGETLRGQTDWDKLVYNFRESPGFSNTMPPVQPGGSSAIPEDVEMTEQTFQQLDNLPPPIPSGVFNMDGSLDTSATLLATNGGINLYARYKSGQLYVAANSAQSTGGDMFILVTDEPTLLRNSPSGKGGSTAGWSLYLKNSASDNSSGWFDSSETAYTSLTTDTAGTYLEGVVNLEYFLGKAPTKLYLAAGKYDTSGSGALIAQVPVGNGDPNIEITEFYEFFGKPVPKLAFVQQGNKLVGGGAANGPVGVFQGTSVALSGDGNTAIVGAPSDNSYAGASWIFTRNGDTWSQQGNKLVGTGASGLAYQGYAVAISSDGNTAIVGGYSDNNNIGAAWIFTRTGGVWTQQGSKLIPNDYVHLPQFGESVSISSDGNTAIIGGPIDNGAVGMGASWIFVRKNGVWSQQGSKLIGTGSLGYDPWQVEQGYSVAISGDGNTAMIGSYQDDSAKGAVWIFTRNDTVWSQQGNKLVGSGGATHPANSWQGSSVALSFDGNTAVSGGLNDDSLRGAVWVFTRNGIVWTQQGSKIVGTGGVGWTAQGASVSLSGDGNTMIVGGYADSNNAGAAWVFTRSSSVWSQLGSKLVGTGAANTPYMAFQGNGVALSEDGNTAIVGGPDDSHALGASWIFTRQITPLTTLGSFSASIIGGDLVRLDWTTLSENSNYGFTVLRSADSLGTFSALAGGFVPGYGTSGLPHSYVFVDSTSAGGNWYYRLRIASMSSTYLYSDVVHASTVTGLKDQLKPARFALYQSYPNPFNPTTNIRFEIAKLTHVRLRVYDLLGQEVAMLIDDIRSPGSYEVPFNAGSALASGVYFYRIEAGEFVATKKLMLIR